MSKKMRMVSMAPMMDCTDRHDRFFLRLISKNIFLYSEMIATGAILNGDKKKILEFSEFEKPVALQLGGSNLNELSKCCKIVEDFGYDEINLNLGCPSKKVQKNKFGACLIKEPDLVADCLSKMINSTSLPVTAKTRIGFDDVENFEYLNAFIEKIKKTGVKTIILHARKAILKGLSPKQNREIPPLNYERVRKLKDDFPDLEIIINGGIKKLSFLQDNDLQNLDGIMIGREAYSNPLIFKDVDKKIKGELNRDISIYEITQKMFDYFETLENESHIKRGLIHMHGLFSGHSEAKKIRVLLSNSVYLKKSKNEILSILEKNIIEAA